MAYSLKFIIQDDVEKIFDAFSNLFDIRTSFLSSTGEEFVGKNKPVCRFCKLLQEKLDFRDACEKLDNIKMHEAAEQKKNIVYQCHAGLTEAITPIFTEDELIGYVIAGQFRTTKKRLNAPLANLWKKQVGNDELEKAYNQTPYYEKGYFKNIMTLFSIMIDFIISKRLIEVRGSNSIVPIVNFMKNHLDENLSVEQAAGILIQSRSSFSHKFKSLTGKSFKQFQIELKLDKADEYFRKKSHLSIKEVAMKLGFEDPFYFSRLYKKHRGRSPSFVKKEFKNKQ